MPKPAITREIGTIEAMEKAVTAEKREEREVAEAVFPLPKAEEIEANGAEQAVGIQPDDLVNRDARSEL